LLANNWTAIWIYFVGPIAGMSLAGWLYRLRYRRRHGECYSLKMHMTGEPTGCQTYQVLWWSGEINNNKLAEHQPVH